MVGVAAAIIFLQVLLARSAATPGELTGFLSSGGTPLSCSVVSATPAAPGQLSIITAMEVAPSTGVLFMAASDGRNTGRYFVYRDGMSNLTILPVTRPASAVTPATTIRHLSLMEVGSAVLLMLAATETGKTVEIFRVEDPLNTVLPRSLTLLQRAELQGTRGSITGMWAVWPRGLYVTSCRTNSGGVSNGCAVHHCQPQQVDSANWRDEELRLANTGSHGAEERAYTCTAAWEAPSDHLALQGAVGSPLLSSLFVLVDVDSAVQPAATGGLGEGKGEFAAEPLLLGWSRDSRGRQPAHIGEPWIAANVSNSATAAAGSTRRRGMWGDVSTGELLLSATVHRNGASAPSSANSPARDTAVGKCVVESLALMPEGNRMYPAYQTTGSVGTAATTHSPAATAAVVVASQVIARSELYGCAGAVRLRAKSLGASAMDEQTTLLAVGLWPHSKSLEAGFEAPLALCQHTRAPAAEQTKTDEDNGGETSVHELDMSVPSELKQEL
jgi:hypothetical protein